jgi:hypothetical protein
MPKISKTIRFGIVWTSGQPIFVAHHSAKELLEGGAGIFWNRKE